MNYLERLNASQLSAALWETGPLLVLAGPGSGKTATLTARVARLVESSRGESFRILCLTFTRKAAAEMRNRVLALVPDANEKVLLTTFHSFTIDILRQHGNHFNFSPDFEIIDDAERVRIIKSLLAGRESEFSKILSAERALSAIEFFFRNLTEDAQVPTLLQDSIAGQQYQTLFSEYKQRLKELNALDYGAILYFCEELLRTRPRLAKQLRTVYRHICVDEFQDTNLAQYRILRALAPDRDANIFIVGDDDQVIYQWNGASPSRINELAQHYDIHTVQLPENYRCPPAVVNLANLLIQHNGDRAIGKLPLQPMKKADGATNAVALMRFGSQLGEAQWIATDIARRIEEGTKPKDVVVLARNTKLLESVQRELTTLSVSAFIQKRKSQFESAPMRFITACLKVALVRHDEESTSILTKAISDCIEDDVELDALLALASQVNGDHLEALGILATRLQSFPKDLRDALQDLIAGTFAKFVRSSLSFFDFVEQQGEEGKEQYADYTSERQVWNNILDELGGESQAYALTLGQFLQELALANKTPEAPSNAVRCLTIHSSKGMEFTHVYLMGMAEDQLPSFQSKKGGADSREMQEERRNCFVAITRTIKSLTLSYASMYNGWRKDPSRFLTEMGLLTPGGYVNQAEQVGRS